MNNMENNFWSNFFRKDLNLKARWWHRLFFVGFVIAFIWIGWATISNMLDDAQLPKYSKVGMLSDRMDSEIRLIGSLVKPEEKIAVYEHNLYGEYNGKTFYDGNGGWLVKQEYYCSKNVSDQVEKIVAKTGVNYYSGTTGLDSLANFKSYLAQNKATCVSVNSYNPLDNTETREKLMWGYEPDGMAVWQESLVKSIFAVLQTLFFVVLGFSILLVLYYKVFLFIVFGSKKNI